MAFTRAAARRAAQHAADEIAAIQARLDQDERLTDGEARYLLRRVEAVRPNGPTMTRIRSFVGQFVDDGGE